MHRPSVPENVQGASPREWLLSLRKWAQVKTSCMGPCQAWEAFWAKIAPLAIPTPLTGQQLPDIRCYAASTLSEPVALLFGALDWTGRDCVSSRIAVPPPDNHCRRPDRETRIDRPIRQYTPTGT